MAHKSHRQKALQAQLEAPREISVVKPKTKKGPVAAPAPVEAEMDVDGEGFSDDDEVLINQQAGPSSAPTAATASMEVDGAAASSSGFAPLSAAETSTTLKGEFRRVPIPPHRMTPLKREWINIYTPLVEMLGLQVRMNVKRRAVEIKVSGGGRLGEEPS